MIISGVIKQGEDRTTYSVAPANITDLAVDKGTETRIVSAFTMTNTADATRTVRVNVTSRSNLVEATAVFLRTSTNTITLGPSEQAQLTVQFTPNNNVGATYSITLSDVWTRVIPTPPSNNAQQP